MKRANLKYWPTLKQFTTMAFFLILVTLLGLFSAVTGLSMAIAGTIAEVNQQAISSSTVDGMLRAYLSGIGHQELAASRMLGLREEMLKRLIEEELLYQEGLKEGLTVTETEIDAGVAKIRSRFQSEQSYAVAVQKEALKRRDIRAGVKRSILINKTWAHLSMLNQAERSMRLKSMSEDADIQIHARPIRPSRQITQMNRSLQP